MQQQFLLSAHASATKYEACTYARFAYMNICKRLQLLALQIIACIYAYTTSDTLVAEADAT